MASQQGMLRGVSAVKVVGPLGAASSVYDKNWRCKACNAENYARRTRCFRCNKFSHEAAEKVHAPDGPVPDHPWREAMDPATMQLYYYNIKTMETQWTRPVEMGPAPSATGWFGRGAAGNDTQSKYAAMNDMFLSRPARIQAAIDLKDRGRLENTNDFNIWYGKFLGEHWNQGMGSEPAEHRCVVETDAGYTKADTIHSKEHSYFCIHFARGMCCRGLDCTYYHRVPTAVDDGHIDRLHDVFGRERHNTHRDDMGGVGSFASDSRTLYIGGLKRTDSTDYFKTISKHFDEWGEVENINVIHKKNIAFVRYRFRANAEFARVAMANQAITPGEVLNIRWANDDPNPVAKRAIERANEDAVAAMLLAKGVSLTPAGYMYPVGYQGPLLPEADDGSVVPYGGPEVAGGVGDGGGDAGVLDVYAQYFSGIGDGSGAGALGSAAGTDSGADGPADPSAAMAAAAQTYFAAGFASMYGGAGGAGYGPQHGWAGYYGGDGGGAAGYGGGGDGGGGGGEGGVGGGADAAPAVEVAPGTLPTTAPSTAAAGSGVAARGAGKTAAASDRDSVAAGDGVHAPSAKKQRSGGDDADK